MTEAGWEKLIADSLREADRNIAPRRELLSEIIKSAGKPAILRPSIRANQAWKIFSSFSLGQQIFAAVGAVMIIAAVLVSLPGNLNKLNQSATSQPTVSQASPAQPTVIAAVQDINNETPTSDDVDAAVTAILASVSDEDSTLTNEVSDESLSDDDSATVNNLIQNYDQDEF